MNRPGPAPERGGVPIALANIRKGGLKKARGTSVIADMTRTELPEQAVNAPAAALHAVPALEETAGAPAPVTPAQAPAEIPVQTPPPAAQAPAPAPVVQAAAAPQSPPRVPATPPAEVQSVPAAAPEQTPEPEPPAAVKKAYRKTSFFQSQESGSRMRSAYMATRHLTGYRTLSDFILAAVEREVEALEKTYNEGNMFDADPGSVPRGRPLEL